MRIATTLIGMTVTDCWRAFKHAMPQKRNKEIAIKAFADRMAYDCIKNPHSNSSSLNGYLPVTENDGVPNTVGGGRQSDISSITEAATAVNVFAEHPFKPNPEREQGGIGRPIRRVCKFPKCSKTIHFMCFHRVCLEHEYVSPHGIVKGVFYCSEHQYKHYERVLEGNGKV
jgi:hypothetical protein